MHGIERKIISDKKSRREASSYGKKYKLTLWPSLALGSSAEFEGLRFGS